MNIQNFIPTKEGMYRTCGSAYATIKSISWKKPAAIATAIIGALAITKTNSSQKFTRTVRQHFPAGLTFAAPKRSTGLIVTLTLVAACVLYQLLGSKQAEPTKTDTEQNLEAATQLATATAQEKGLIDSQGNAITRDQLAGLIGKTIRHLIEEAGKKQKNFNPLIGECQRLLEYLGQPDMELVENILPNLTPLQGRLKIALGIPDDAN